MTDGVLTGVNVLCGGKDYMAASVSFEITRREYFTSAVAGSVPVTVGGVDLHYVALPEDASNVLVEREGGAWKVRGGARVFKGMVAEEVKRR